MGWRRLKLAYYLVRYTGPRELLIRVGVYLRQRTGYLRKVFAPRPWQALDLADLCRSGIPTEAQAYAQFKRDQELPFIFPLGTPPSVPDAMRDGPREREPGLGRRIELLAQRRCVYFFRAVSAEPVDWHRNPFDRTVADRGVTWCDLPDYSPEQGDPRLLWEPSRASWAIDLARARGWGHDPDRLADLYWDLVGSWMAANPPFRGFQWKCGQEAAVRMIAILLGAWSLGDRPAFDGERWQGLAKLAWATGYRIQRHIGYAISQKNNHAMSEAAGLLLIATLFPELRNSDQWRALGRKVLQEEVLRQIHDDGSYCQQSTNYQRVMMQASMLGLRLGEISGEPFDKAVYDKIGKSARFLYHLTDDKGGRVPQHGNNDGAWILPLDECAFWDFRPVIQTAQFLVHGTLIYEAGPWDEDLLWLFGDRFAVATRTQDTKQVSKVFPDGGICTLRGSKSWAMLRCPNHTDRVGHSDPLHVDLFQGGYNLLRDTGTYKYYVPERYDVESYFSSIQAHNCLTIDGDEPMPRYSRFRRFPLTKTRIIDYRPEGLVPQVAADFPGYNRGPWNVLWRRRLALLPGDNWLIVDDLFGQGIHKGVLRWHLPDTSTYLDNRNHALEIKLGEDSAFITMYGSSQGRRISRNLSMRQVRGRHEIGAFQGFAAPCYGELTAIPVLEGEQKGAMPMRFVTVVTKNRPGQLRHFNGSDHCYEIWLNDAWTRIHIEDLSFSDSGVSLLE